MAKRPIDQQAWSKNWKSGMDGAQQKYVKGVMSTDVDPMEAAAQKLDKAKANYIAAIDSGKTAKGLRSVSKATWQQITSTKGGARLSTGATEALPKVNARIAALAPAMDQLRQQINAMPNDTYADREQRQTAWNRGMRAIAGK